MTEEEKIQLIETNEFTFCGYPATVAGYKNDYASISAAFPGLWRATWETVERVAQNGGEFKASDVTLSSRAWLGSKPIPKELAGWW